jgi:hypothetical protein
MMIWMLTAVFTLVSVRMGSAQDPGENDMSAEFRDSDLHVANDGSDAGSGHASNPFATLERARDAVRQLKVADELPAGGINVWLRGGEYPLAQTLTLDGRDSGTPASPITWRAWPGESVRVHGGQLVPAQAWSPVADEATADRLDAGARAHIVKADLQALGVTDLGSIPVTFRGAAPVPELFCNDQRMTVARWPNEGWAEIDEIIERGARPRDGDESGVPGTFAYSGDRPERWDLDAGVWLDGYYCYDWYNETIAVKSIDIVARHITFERPHLYGLGGGNRAPRRYKAIEVLAELDQPGEYYIDRRSGILYFWPPAPVAECRIVLSVLDAPLIALAGVSHVTWRGLAFETGRRQAIAVEGGQAITIAGCEVRNTGEGGITITDGERHTVVGCDIHDTGTGGLYLTGGDRRNLVAAGHQAINNHIYRVGNRQRTHAYAIHLNGVGNRIAHCLLRDIPHQAIGLGGNDHVFEYNVIHHTGMETDDAGAFYMGRNPSERGNIVRYNFWHHIGAPRSHGNNAIYFDDGAGGSTVFGNILFRCGNPGGGSMGAVFCHGGHENLVDNNIFIECKRAIGAAPWKDEHWRNFLVEYRERMVEEVDIRSALYTSRYPELKGYLDYTDAPRLNTAVRNLVVWGGEFISGNYQQSDNLITGEDPGFVDAAGGDFTLRDDASVFDKIPGFQPIPFGEMGLYVDEIRPELPEDPWIYPPPVQLPPLVLSRS